MSEKKYADMHNHTTFSDGLYTPNELVKRAKLKGLYAIAITDHDTTGGLNDAIEAGNNYGVELIPGIELNAQEEDSEIHILGYYIDYNRPWFQDLLGDIQNERYIRAVKMIEKLNATYAMGLDIFDIERRAGGRYNIGRPHIARAMVDKGIAKNMAQAFSKYLCENSQCYVERYRMTVPEAIETIKKLGGVPVLAHPGLIGDQKLIKRLLEYDFLGVEAYHSKHSDEESKYFSRLAMDHELAVTGGSDCHGDGDPMVGDVIIPYEMVDKLKGLAESIR